mmetsp:Transcript_6934/g.24677  ORF Transcript_6934/g.24677 Transcript_6934/m.24677 type:complete len:181 (-) Transcript_6934:1800-2342(-)
MKVTTDDASELERVLRDVQEQQRTPKAKHEGYGRELVPFFQPGLDTINTQLVTFPKKGSTEGKEIDCKSNKGKTKTKKEENGSETNNDNADPNRKKKRWERDQSQQPCRCQRNAIKWKNHHQCETRTRICWTGLLAIARTGRSAHAYGGTAGRKPTPSAEKVQHRRQPRGKNEGRKGFGR